MNAEDRLKQMMGEARAETRATEAEWADFVRRGRRALFARRAAAAAGAVALIGIGVFAAVALTSDDPSTSPLPPAGSPTASPAPRPTAPTGPVVIDVPGSEGELWFVQDERLSWGTAGLGGQVGTLLTGGDPSLAREALWLQQLVDGPTGPDLEVEASTAIPKDTELLGVARDGSTLDVDLSSEFGSGGGSLSMQLRVAQVVYTGTQFDGIDAVQILIEGERVDALGGEGVVIADPLTRRDFQDQAPPIVVETPKPNDTVTSGALVTGFANVFEANVNVRVIGENGKKLVETFTTATCGTGCWGDFSKGLEFSVDHEQAGRVEVLTFSAEDGSEQDLISIPVTLAP
jgi:hypothetical protein